jgi:glycosyltransferase involved in cell wall biosynthesis
VAAVVAHGESGTLVPEGDTEAFAGAVRYLLLHPDLRDGMRLAGAERIRREHDINVVTAFLHQELAGIINDHKR